MDIRDYVREILLNCDYEIADKIGSNDEFYA